MNENNELSDIVLNKNSNSSSSKKMILAVATLGIILIAVITIMKSCGSDNVNGAPQAVIPPQPQQNIAQEQDQTINEEPLFEEVEVIQDDAVESADLDKIAQKLKEESQIQQTTEAPKVTQTVSKPATQPTVKPVTKNVVDPTKYYVQVGSFSKYEPNKKFLTSITSLGYNYTYHKVKRDSKTLNKVLVGPFTTEKEAKNARRTLRSKVEPGAFLVKLK